MSGRDTSVWHQIQFRTTALAGILSSEVAAMTEPARKLLHMGTATNLEARHE
jgi:hypothetical protein